MRLGQKNLAYSMILAGIMLSFLLGYFIYMLPYLYVEHMMEQNLKSVREQHDSYVANGTYEGVAVKNSFGCVSMEIPMEGNVILVTGKAFSAEILEGILQADASLPVEIRLLYTLDMTDAFTNETVRIHPFSDTKVAVEASVEDGDNQYVNYMVIEWRENSLILSFLPVVAPQLGEIRPVVLQSLPMLGAVIMLMVLLFSGIYSKGIVAPIVELVHHTEQMKDGKNSRVERLSGKWRGRKDEVGRLADTLDDFYQQIRQGYDQLEEKNMELEERGRQQEVFLRASSHQLKTPIAAALLKDLDKLASPAHLLAVSCGSEEKEREITCLLLEHNVNYKRSNNDIEMLYINAKGGLTENGR